MAGVTPGFWVAVFVPGKSVFSFHLVRCEDRSLNADKTCLLKVVDSSWCDTLNGYPNLLVPVGV